MAAGGWPLRPVPAVCESGHPVADGAHRRQAKSRLGATKSVRRVMLGEGGAQDAPPSLCGPVFAHVPWRAAQRGSMLWTVHRPARHAAALSGGASSVTQAMTDIPIVPTNAADGGLPQSDTTEGGRVASISWVGTYRTDILIAAGLALAAGALSLIAAQQFDPSSLTDQNKIDIWYQGDLPRVFEQVNTRWHDGARSRFHPLFNLLTHPMAFGLRKVLGISKVTAAHAVTACYAALWIVLMFAVLRAAGCRRLDAGLFTLVGVTGAAYVFWFAVPETFFYGSSTVLAAVLVAAVAGRRTVSDRWFVAGGLASVAMTVTNFVTGFLLAVSRRPWRRSAQIVLNVVAFLTLLWAAERRLYPNITFFLDEPDASRHLNALTPTRAGQVTRVFFSHAAVMPRLELCHATHHKYEHLSAQGTPVTSAGVAGGVATLAWFALLLPGLWAMWRLTDQAPLRFVVAGSLVGSLAIHLIYGGETFLYSPHWWPLLVVAAALATRTQFRRVAIGLATVFVLAGGVNNISQWRRASEVFGANGTAAIALSPGLICQE